MDMDDFFLNDLDLVKQYLAIINWHIIFGFPSILLFEQDFPAMSGFIPLSQ